MEPVAPKIREELKQTKDEFRALLTADQQARFDEMLKKQQSHPREPHRMPAKAPEQFCPLDRTLARVSVGQV